MQSFSNNRLDCMDWLKNNAVTACFPSIDVWRMLLVLFGDWELNVSTTEVAGGLTMPPALPYPVRAGGNGSDFARIFPFPLDFSNDFTEG